MSTFKENQQNSISLSNDEAATLQLKFLTPLVSAIVFGILVVAIGLFYFESDSQSHGLLHERFVRTQAVAKNFYEHHVHKDTNALRAVMDVLKHDKKLSELFASHDRNVLLEYTETLFKELKRDYKITHFYFNRPDRVNILRVHAPGRYGDRIDRVTALQAEQSGSFASGIELGVLGTLTLRVVSPWHNRLTGRLIGYVELGMEVAHIVDELGEVFGLDTVVVIYKQYLERRVWEDGMRELDRIADWGRFDQVVLSAEIPQQLPPVLTEQLKHGELGYRNEAIELKYGDSSYWLLSMPVVDASGRKAAELLLLADTSFGMDMAQRTVLIVGTTVFVLGGLLIVFFSRQASRVGRRIEHDERILKQLATHDSLTGLYTRRMFHEYLNAEIDRSARFNHPLSLLLIDIDHFKRVNDTYGHQAGDEVLRGLSERLIREVRTVDYVCRYGGEEITVILPETDAETARKFADRINSVVATLPFDINNDQSIPITVSTGIASYPTHADSETFLIAAADKALYAAKDGGRNRVCTYTS